MTQNSAHSYPALTALERMRVRDALEALWCEQIRTLSDLSLQRQGIKAADATMQTADAPSIETAIHATRASIAAIERAITQLDARAGSIDNATPERVIRLPE